VQLQIFLPVYKLKIIFNYKILLLLKISILTRNDDNGATNSNILATNLSVLL